MKKYLIMIFALLFIPVVSAAITVDSIRGYVNNDRVLDINENGGDFDVVPGDAIDLVVRLQNSANITIQAKLTGIIESIDNNADITKTQDFFDINANDNSLKTLSFSIPTNVRNDEFNMKLKIINGSGDIIKTISYNVVVDKITTQNEVSINDLLANLTNSCNTIVDTTRTCFNYISTAANCTSELSTVKEERGTYKQNSDDCSASLSTTNANKAEIERQKTNLENQMSSMITKIDCINQTETAVTSVEERNTSKFNQTIMFIGLGAIGYILYQKRKKSKSTVAGAYEEEYFSHS